MGPTFLLLHETPDSWYMHFFNIFCFSNNTGGLCVIKLRRKIVQGDQEASPSPDPLKSTNSYYKTETKIRPAFKSQTSWGRLELKPSRSNQGSGTWIVFSKNFYLRLSLWVYTILSSLLLLPLPKSTSVFLCLSSRYYPGFGFHYAPVPLEVSVAHVQTISTGVKGSDAQGRRTSTTQIVVSVRDCRQGYSPTPSFNVDWGMPPGRRLKERERRLDGNNLR